MSQTLRYLSKSALNSTLDEIPASSGAASSDNLQKVDSDDLPCSRRTMRTYFFWCEPRAPWHFLATVLKYTYDERDNRLAWLRELDKCPNHYEFQVATDVYLKKQPALLLLLSTSTFIDVKGCMSSGHLRVRIFTLLQKPIVSQVIFSQEPSQKGKAIKFFTPFECHGLNEQSNDCQTNIY